MKKVLFLFIFALLLIGYFILNLSDDIVSSKYTTYNQLQKDEIISKGWLANILPKDIKNIEVNNNLDLNTSWGSFELSKDSTSEFIKKLEKKDKYYRYKNWSFFIDEKNNTVKYYLNISIKP